jgi:hypothetical protein
MSAPHCGRIALASLLAAGLVLIVANTARCDEQGRDVLVLSLAASADLASTRYGLSRGLREGNPVMSEPAVAIAAKAAGIAATAWGCDRLRRGGHPRGAKWLRWGVVAVWGGMAAHNLHAARTAR